MTDHRILKGTFRFQGYACKCKGKQRPISTLNIKGIGVSYSRAEVTSVETKSKSGLPKGKKLDLSLVKNLLSKGVFAKLLPGLQEPTSGEIQTNI